MVGMEHQAATSSQLAATSLSPGWRGGTGGIQQSSLKRGLAAPSEISLSCWWGFESVTINVPSPGRLITFCPINFLLLSLGEFHSWQAQNSFIFADIPKQIRSCQNKIPYVPCLWSVFSCLLSEFYGCVLLWDRRIYADISVLLQIFPYHYLLWYSPN